MKAFGITSLLALALFGGACSTNHGQATGTNSNYVNETQANPAPPASPTARPGMTPEDPRDAQHITRPQPSISPPTTKP